MIGQGENAVIRNLNQVTFRDFGTVPPERTQGLRELDKNTAATWQLSHAEAEVYRAKTQTWIGCGSGTSVLSVSGDGEQYQDYYLDKSVWIKPNVLFTVSPFLGEATVLVAAEEPPELVGHRASGDLRLSPQIQVEGIYTFFYQEKEQGFVFPGESHPMAELTYVDQGSLHSVADGQDLLLKQGDLVIYGPGQWHMQYADIGVAPRFVTLSFVFKGAELSPLLNRRFTAPQQVAELLKGMLQEQERMDGYSNGVILAQLNLLLLLLLRESDAPKDRKLQTASAVHSENEIIRQAQQYISTHIRQKLSVPLVARQVDVSPSYLTALFHKNLQISPGEYIRRIKLQESKQMIRENNLNFTQIAAELQYSTVHHFSRQFKEKFGITPTEYAKSVR